MFWSDLAATQTLSDYTYLSLWVIYMKNLFNLYKSIYLSRYFAPLLDKMLAKDDLKCERIWIYADEKHIKRACAVTPTNLSPSSSTTNLDLEVIYVTTKE